MNSNLEKLMFEELEHASIKSGIGGFLPAVKQIANVSSLPAIVGVRHWFILFGIKFLFLDFYWFT